MRLHIAHSKSRNDRYAILSNAALDLLTRYWFEHGRPRDFLYPKQRGDDNPIDTFFLSRHIHAHEKRLGWKQRLTCHSFRHAFGTHLHENGTDLLTIKALMGHKSLNSTTIYVHLSAGTLRKAISPFDSLAGEYHEWLLNPLIYCNRKLSYGLFHRCCAEPLLELSADKKWLPCIFTFLIYCFSCFFRPASRRPVKCS